MRESWRLMSARRAALVGLLCAALAAVPSVEAKAAPECLSTSIGVDTSLANAELLVWQREFWNQLFVASDTLIQSITVWRPARDTLQFVSAKLYIMAVDSSFDMERPDWHHVLLDGPTIPNSPGGDGTHPIPLTWSFDPPFALPSRGQFSFELRPSDCFSPFPVLAASDNPYLGGDAWEMESTGSCDVGCCAGQRYGPLVDMVFRIEFCEPVVAAQVQTWGRVKASYR
jgi:hypothetical protein